MIYDQWIHRIPERVSLTNSIWDAEDLVQDTIARALGRLAHFGQVLNPRAYLFRIATNAWLDQQRRTELPEPLEAAESVAYLEAFNRRDLDALGALFHEKVTNVILGDWEEHGVETMRCWSLKHWKAEANSICQRSITATFSTYDQP